MEISNANVSDVATASSTIAKKKPGRKPKVFLDNKPIDPKYYINYYHDVIKKKEHLCPYCSKKFACQYNVSRHLNNKRKACAVQHLAEKNPRDARGAKRLHLRCDVRRNRRRDQLHNPFLP